MIHHRIAPLMEMTLNNESTHRDNNVSLNSINQMGPIQKRNKFFQFQQFSIHISYV